MIGDRLRELRRARQLTLRALAEATGLSAALLSQIENGKTDPSVETLRRLAKVFDSDLADLFREPDAPAVHISRPGERFRMQAPAGRITYERLTPGRGDLEVLHADLAPGDVSAVEPWGHVSTECVYVIAGQIVATVDGSDHEVRAGESITFDSRLPHLFANRSETRAQLILAVTPPTP
ncbi:helix-turn-helix domain-containing protein [Ruania suaedae]|uniref:helix-turn-helix domain-containing protein n=1 Tax=Ruania suaedae TaxID=2897774 RepID=UPI001E5AD471|nr:helix-turn-helix domain-containing protein [Ruania suaedae]UFU03177.1 helix-turn-helix domain-containing protein [Ruania suaedae]